MKKKFLCALLLLPLCLLTGCTKNYKTVSDYSADMLKVREKLGDYTIEADTSSGGQYMYLKSMIKGNLWKTEMSNDGGKSYANAMLYDGKEIYTYSKIQPIAVSIPLKQMIAKQVDNNGDDSPEKAMKWINPIGVALYWDLNIKDNDIDKTFNLGKIVQKNGFDCRMVTYISEDGEFCVSDKYGMAVYSKMTDKVKNQTIEINVKKIDNTPLSDSDVSLPAGIKKMSMEDLMKNMLNMMQKQPQ